MLEGLLTEEDCRNCKLCCYFENDELIDAPMFTKEEKGYIIGNINSNIKFKKNGNIYQIILEKEDKLYKCPLLTSNGCILKERRPFDCQSWPLYIMKENNQYYITISNDCSTMNKVDKRKIIQYIEKDFLKTAKYIIKNNPDMITEYNRNLKILYKI